MQGKNISITKLLSVSWSSLCNTDSQSSQSWESNYNFQIDKIIHLVLILCSFPYASLALQVYLFKGVFHTNGSFLMIRNSASPVCPGWVAEVFWASMNRKDCGCLGTKKSINLGATIHFPIYCSQTPLLHLIVLPILVFEVLGTF